jgi:hypothetical protein
LRQAGWDDTSSARHASPNHSNRARETPSIITLSKNIPAQWRVGKGRQI